MEPLFIEELNLITDLSSRTYTGLTLTSNSDDDERDFFNSINPYYSYS